MAWLLKEINKATLDAGGCLDPPTADHYRSRYRALPAEAERECPPPDEDQRKEGQRGRLGRSKSRNLLERLRDYEEDVLRFMVEAHVPFSNNQAENDLRMTKVQQKIAGCSRSWERPRSSAEFVVTRRPAAKTASRPAEALRLLFRRQNSRISCRRMVTCDKKTDGLSPAGE